MFAWPCALRVEIHTWKTESFAESVAASAVSRRVRASVGSTFDLFVFSRLGFLRITNTPQERARTRSLCEAEPTLTQQSAPINTQRAALVLKAMRLNDEELAGS